MKCALKDCISYSKSARKFCCDKCKAIAFTLDEVNYNKNAIINSCGDGPVTYLHVHEMMDRVHVLMSSFDEHIANNHVCCGNTKIRMLAGEINEKLMALYQAVAAETLNYDFRESKVPKPIKGRGKRK